MSAPAAISGSFADYRLVKSRSVLQLVIEIPVEGQADAFEALGYPMPGVEIPVAIARLTEPACAPQRERPAAPPSPHAGGGATSTPDVGEGSVLDAGARSSTQPGCGTKMRRPWYDMPPSQRAGIMCGEERFWIWLSRFKGVLVTDEDEATNWLYQECGIDSRSELRLDTDASPDVQAFLREQLRVFYAVESDYRKWAGLEREVR